jgi:hypothetical protein
MAEHISSVRAPMTDEVWLPFVQDDADRLWAINAWMARRAVREPQGPAYVRSQAAYLCRLAEAIERELAELEAPRVD